MGMLERLRSWLASESAEARDVGRRTRSRLEAALDRREAELAAGPSEKLEMLQNQAAENDAAIEAIRDRIEGRTARADAVDDLADDADDADDAEIVGDEGPDETLG